MSEDKPNGSTTEITEEDIKAEAGPEEKKEPVNEAFIEDGVMRITLYLYGDSAYAKSVGSLELAKDLVKGHFARLSMETAMRRPKIIVPNTVH